MRARGEIDMVNGRLGGKIIKFAFPLVLTGMLQMLYNAADMIIVSLSSEPDAVGAIGSSAAMINLFINLEQP